MRILLHICCAHCFAKALAGLREEYGDGLEVEGLWYNPNIHPLLEYRRRLKGLQVLLERVDVPVRLVDEYGLEAFCAAVHPAYGVPERCAVCYRMRLRHAAEVAGRDGFDALASTLTTSTHQPHELIRSVGEAEAVANGVAFLYRDWRGVEVPVKLLSGVYHQQYCGCVFSECDRFAATSKHLYRGDGRDG